MSMTSNDSEHLAVIGVLVGLLVCWAVWCIDGCQLRTHHLLRSYDLQRSNQIESSEPRGPTVQELMDNIKQESD